MCVDCMNQFHDGSGFKPRPATLVHHVVPVTERPDIALDIDNLRSLCDPCHNRRHPEKGGQGTKRQHPAAAARMRIIKIRGTDE
ncbi:HNH endonuclease [Eubacteriales bacterium OttesenSCG-928-A19]|nr:HNH endonuclease [Eubacteriales bacterium OttesenSCG-928-A19]